jgi:hypothetical protein
MADFTQDKKYSYVWQSSKFKDLALSGSNISQFANDAGYITSTGATGSFLITASVSSNTITFTKGDGSTFPITVNTGSSGGSLPGNPNTSIQFNGNGVFSGSRNFTFNSSSNALTLTGSLNISGSTTQIGTNILIGNTTLTGSLNVSGSTLFVGTHTLSGSNTITGNTVLSGSIEVSGSSNFKNSIFIVTGSAFFKGVHSVSGSTSVTGSFDVIDGNINIVSGSSFTRWGNKLFNYGQFSDTTTQSGSANTAYSMKFNTTDFALNTRIVSQSRITVDNTGLYDLQFSAQLGNTANTTIEFDIWFAYTGSNIAHSNTNVTLNKVPGSNGRLVAAWNFATPIQAGDYIEIKWSCDAATGQIQAAPSASTPTRPAIPSVIATLTQIA